MPLPAASFINQLDPTQPTGTQKKYEGDDWFRLIQYVLQTQFPLLGSTAVTATALDLNTITRAIRVAPGEVGPILPNAAARANGIWTWDATGLVPTFSRTFTAFDSDVAATAAARNTAVQAAIDAGAFRDTAQLARDASIAARDLSQQWATSLTVVSGGLYGARFYAQAASASAANAGTSETNAGVSATNAANSAAQAGNTLNGTSTTSLTVGVGSKSLTTQTNKAWLPGSRIRLASQGTPGATMRGNVTAYTAGTGALTFLADGFTGSGTLADWNIVTTGADGTGGTNALMHITGTTQAAAADTPYVFENASASTLTLRAAPSDGERVFATVSNGRTDNVIARNGKNIMGLAEDLTINLSTVTVGLQYNATTGDWRLI